MASGVAIKPWFGDWISFPLVVGKEELTGVTWHQSPFDKQCSVPTLIAWSDFDEHSPR
jgi:hypothetical protein